MIKNVWRDFKTEKPEVGQTEVIIVPKGRGIKHGKYDIDLAYLCTERNNTVAAAQGGTYRFDEVKYWLYIPEYRTEESECEAKWIEISDETPNEENINILIVVSADRGTSIGYGAVDIAYRCDLENKVFTGIHGDYSFEEVQAWMKIPKYVEREHIDIETANKIAQDFIKKHNSNLWNGVGDTDKEFSTQIEVYNVFDKDIYMTIQFDIDSDEGGDWAHEVKLYEAKSGEMIDGYFGRGIDSTQNIANTIMDLCKAYGVK